MLIPDTFYSIFGFINTWKPSHKYIILHYLSVWNVGWSSYHVGCIVQQNQWQEHDWGKNNDGEKDNNKGKDDKGEDGQMGQGWMGWVFMNTYLPCGRSELEGLVYFILVASVYFVYW